MTDAAAVSEPVTVDEHSHTTRNLLVIGGLVVALGVVAYLLVQHQKNQVTEPGEYFYPEDHDPEPDAAPQGGPTSLLEGEL